MQRDAMPWSGAGREVGGRWRRCRGGDTRARRGARGAAAARSLGPGVAPPGRRSPAGGRVRGPSGNGGGVPRGCPSPGGLDPARSHPVPRPSPSPCRGSGFGRPRRPEPSPRAVSSGAAPAGPTLRGREPVSRAFRLTQPYGAGSGPRNRPRLPNAGRVPSRPCARAGPGRGAAARCGLSARGGRGGTPRFALPPAGAGMVAPGSPRQVRGVFPVFSLKLRRRKGGICSVGYASALQAALG